MQIAFVTPWYGLKIPGGAEAEARRTAEQLAKRGHDVRVLTTCIRDFHADWGKNFHKAGTTIENGVKVSRFKVKRRDKAAFDAVNSRLMAGQMVPPADQQTYVDEMINCPALPQAISKQSPETIFIFIPYMFATTYFGAQVRPERSLLVPCFHDEVYARMGMYREVYAPLRGLVLHTQSELALAQRFLGDAGQQVRAVLGEGVDVVSAEASSFIQKYQIDTPFILYAGRREQGKNTPLLLRYWARFVREHDAEVQLILLGTGAVPDLPPQARDLGFVPRQDMLDGMAAATVFCLPSVNESFSLVVMESWLCGTPSLVHGDCAVTVEHCQRSNGGLYFNTYAEFAATINYFLAHPQTTQEMGRLGRRYVLDNFQWDTIIDRYEALITQIAKQETV